jgi:hypothetical protein
MIDKNEMNYEIFGEYGTSLYECINCQSTAQEVFGHGLIWKESPPLKQKIKNL